MYVPAYAVWRMRSGLVGRAQSGAVGTLSGNGVIHDLLGCVCRGMRDR